MGDIYTEILVPRQATPLDIFIKVLLILLTGAAIAAGVIWQPQVLIGAAGLLLFLLGMTYGDRIERALMERLKRR